MLVLYILSPGRPKSKLGGTNMDNDMLSRKELLNALRHLDNELDSKRDEIGATEMLDKILNIIRTFPAANK